MYAQIVKCHWSSAIVVDELLLQVGENLSCLCQNGNQETFLQWGEAGSSELGHVLIY